MTRKLISYIFIYVLLTGCDGVFSPMEPVESECESDFEMEVTSDLVIDENGYYHIEWLEGYNQTFATLTAVTNLQGFNRIYWSCDSGIEHMGEWVQCINGVSYTDEHTGIARQTMGVWEEMIGDTITVYTGYEDFCDNQYIEITEIIVNE